MISFKYQIVQINKHEPTLAVSYVPDDPAYQHRARTVYLDLRLADEYTPEQMSAYVHGEIVRQAPYHDWSQDATIAEHSSSLEPYAGIEVSVSAAEASISRIAHPVTLTLDQARDQAWGRIEMWRNQQESERVTCEYLGHTWDADKASLVRLDPVLKMPSLPQGFIWTTADNQDVEVSLAELAQLEVEISIAIVARGFQIHQHQRQMKTEVEQLTTIQDVLTYTVGWPVAE